MNRALIVILGVSLTTLAACTQRMICPAYQSAFIYDKDELRKKFSYFADDSTPKVFTASKNKYLIAEAMPYRKKIQRMQTVPMKKVFVHVPDSLSGVESDTVITAEMDAAARSVIDSTFIVDVPQAPKDTATTAEDSVYVISKDREIRILKYNSSDSLDYDSVNQRYVKQTPEYYVEEVGFNTEQDNYMWYLRHNLVLPDVRLSKLQAENGGPTPAGKSGKKAKEKKGFFGFFKNLFHKKEKQPVDSVDNEPTGPPPDEFNYVDTTATNEDQSGLQVQQAAPKVKKKGGLFGKKKDQPETAMQADGAATDPPKKKKKKKADKPKTDQPVEDKDKKNEDDGF
jgi:hypothetical protein